MERNFEASGLTTGFGRTETEAFPDSGHFGIRPLSSAATGGYRPFAACRLLEKRTFSATVNG
jgi:hypothetical protein